MIRDGGKPPNLREEALERARVAKTLPVPTSVMKRVFRIIADADSSLAQLHGVVQYDQAISAKIISIANSAYYCRGTSIASLEKAMITVGLKETKRIIVCMVFLQGIMTRWKLRRDDVTALWKHSLTVAHAARALAEKLATEDPEEAFTISILHDVGKVVFYGFGDRYRALVDDASLLRQDICDFERIEYGIDHQEVGHELSIAWGFPEEFSDAILTHHNPHDGETPVIDIVRDADAFVCGREGSLPERERAVLQNEKDWITAETERIRQLVGV
ncbi:MAG: HDOD domain-containing protein [Syntrophorhabdales bacterium]|jgi:putative nucleotidyltransferase with HDIG domain